MPIILILIGLVLVIYNYIALKKESIPFEIHDNEEKLKKITPLKMCLKRARMNSMNIKLNLGFLGKM